MAKEITDTTINDVEDDLVDQIAELRAEVDKLTAGLKRRGYDFLDEASEQFDDLVEDTRHTAVVAARNVREEASASAAAVMEHPVSSAAAATTFLGIGFAIGYMLAATAQEKRRSFW